MRARWIVALVAVLAACDDSVWIEIRVPAGLAVDEVELFLAVDPCERGGEACRGVRPPPVTNSAAAFIPGTVFEHDTDITFVAPVRDGAASFRLAASDDKLPALLAIGVVNEPARPAVGGVVLGELDLSLGARRVIATLEPSDDATRVFRWPDATDPARDQIACAGVHHEREPGTFLVSPTDWDCDGFANDADVECNPLVYRASSPKEACARPTATGGPGDACMLGSGSCEDGLGTTCTVDDIQVCVPQHVCDKCDFPDQRCLEDAFATGTTRISCTFPVVKVGDHWSVCGANNRASAPADLFATETFSCPALPRLTDELFDPDPPASVLTFSTDGQLAALQIVPVQPTPCQIQVELGGDLGLSYQPTRFPLHLDAGGGPPRTIVVPLEIALQEVDQATCDAAPPPEPCTISFEQETVFACVRP